LRKRKPLTGSVKFDDRPFGVGLIEDGLAVAHANEQPVEIDTIELPGDTVIELVCGGDEGIGERAALNADDTGQDFFFSDFVLQPGQSCRIYTNEHHPESGGFSFGSGKALWANSGECGHLFDASGAEVSTYCY
jgi:hypothetical protein